MSVCAVIGGTGFTEMSGLTVVREDLPETPFGEPSAPTTHGELAGAAVVFLPRHGAQHTIPPHRINYRANIWALKELGVTDVLAINAVGGIRPGVQPGDLLMPDQIVDYTWSRPHTFHDSGSLKLEHVDFTQPYSSSLREIVSKAAQTSGVHLWPDGTYGATQGPRLETAAEIHRMEMDGCDVVGMTGMPEASLARELHIRYAALAIIVNHAAGRGEGEITMELIKENLAVGVAKTRVVLEYAIPLMATVGEKCL